MEHPVAYSAHTLTQYIVMGSLMALIRRPLVSTFRMLAALFSPSPTSLCLFNIRYRKARVVKSFMDDLPPPRAFEGGNPGFRVVAQKTMHMMLAFVYIATTYLPRRPHHPGKDKYQIIYKYILCTIIRVMVRARSS